MGEAASFESRLMARTHLKEVAERLPALQELFDFERPPTEQEIELGGEPLEIPWR